MSKSVLKNPVYDCEDGRATRVPVTLHAQDITKVTSMVFLLSCVIVLTAICLLILQMKYWTGRQKKNRFNNLIITIKSFNKVTFRP